MKKILLQEDVEAVEAKLKIFETNTGCELLLVVAAASDDYPAASFRFGLISSFLITLVFSNYYHFQNDILWPISFFVICILMTALGQMTWAKKLGLSDVEADRECREKAIELFHTMGTSKVSHKVTAMIMVSVLEHRIEVLVDELLKTKISQAELDDLILIMQKHFREGHMALGFTQSIESLETKLLADFGGRVSNVSPAELKDSIVFI